MNNYNPFSLAKKTILVTGASSGIGRSTAIECSKMGAKLVITGRNSERLNETFAQLEGDGHCQFVADLSQNDEIADLISKIPQIDGVVNSAGVIMILPFQFCSFEKSYPILDINLAKPIELMYQIIKSKRYNKNSFSIIFISSTSGFFASTTAHSIYSATKAGIVGLTKGMAIDLAPKNIRVNTICPAMIETEMTKKTAETTTQEALEADKKRYPLKRYGKPEEVAYAAIYLLSDASAWVTGSNMLIDGGITLQ